MAHLRLRLQLSLPPCFTGHSKYKASPDSLVGKQAPPLGRKCKFLWPYFSGDRDHGDLNTPAVVVVRSNWIVIQVMTIFADQWDGE